MAGFYSGRALLAAGLLVFGLLALEIAFLDSAPSVSKAAATLSVPGNWAAKEWGNLHDASALLLWIFVNLAFYYFLFVAAIRLKAIVPPRRTS